MRQSVGCRAHQAKRGPGAAEVGDGYDVRRWHDAWVSSADHWPGSIFLLAGGQERHSAANLLPVAFHPREAQHIQCLSGSVGVAGAVLELDPAAILVLPGEESIDLLLEGFACLS